MKRIFLPVVVLVQLLISLNAHAQIDSLIVETYYISDELDATDSDGGSLDSGSVTYRIYLDLSDGFRIMNIFGTQEVPVLISSTAGFFNNTDRGEKFGYEIASSRLDDNTTALDTWLTLGFATIEHQGIIKAYDTDGSIIGGVNNDGGSEDIPGGLLTNTDPKAGIPLQVSDGLLFNSKPFESFDALGIDDYTIFGPTFLNEFIGSNIAISSTSGISGTSAKNHVLIAQLTTRGEISLGINVTLQDSSGTEFIFKYSDEYLSTGEALNKWLSYPFRQGCTDPYYLEYDPGAIISDHSCATEIVYGCLDLSACNYDANANFNIQELCCYGEEDCGGRDFYEVCENYTTLDDESIAESCTIFPNPASGIITVEFPELANPVYTIGLTDIFGRGFELNKLSENQNSATIDISELSSGIYCLLLLSGKKNEIIRFIKL
jgi:hypothetical protein